MSRLDQVLNGQGHPAENVNNNIPEFDENGKTVKQKNKHKGLAITLFVFSGLILAIYVPSFFITLFGKKRQTVSNDLIVSPDITMVKEKNDYLSSHGTDDFDNDRLDNAAEEKYGTNPYDADTDTDGLSDYYEIYVSKTDPLKPDKQFLQDYQKSLDETAGEQVNSPYSCNGVILWADDYASKANGTVVSTPNGYNFFNFKGYASFPESTSGKIYAYTTDHGKYELLDYRDTEKAWRIDGIKKVYIFNEPLEDAVDFHFFGLHTYFSGNWFSKFWAFILPDRGWLTAEKTTVLDVTPDTTRSTTAKNTDFDYDISNPARLGKDTNSLSELQFVYSMLNEDRCVMVSLFSESLGEYRGIVYGYTADDKLLIMDEKTKAHVGEIIVQPRGARMLNDSGEYKMREYFAWSGLGFSYAHYDRISFFAVSKAPSPIVVDPTTEVSTEETTETTETTELPSTEEATTEKATEQPEEKKGEWVQDDKGWWYKYEDGTYPKNEWVKIGKHYYHFDKHGYMSADTVIDGIKIKKNGIAEKNPFTSKDNTETTEKSTETTEKNTETSGKNTEKTVPQTIVEKAVSSTETSTATVKTEPQTERATIQTTTTTMEKEDR